MLPAVTRVPKNADCFWASSVGLGGFERGGCLVRGGGAERHDFNGDDVAAVGVDSGGGGDECGQRREVESAGGGLV